MPKSAIWITWENQRRNRELSAALNTKLYELDEIDEIQNYFYKYFLGLTKTLHILLKEKPRIVFCQNPSFILSLFMVFVKRFTNLKVVVDAHNAGLFPCEGRSSFLMMLSRFVQSRADLTLVTNESLKDYVEKSGGHGLVLPDRIPAIESSKIKQLKGKFNFLFICSYAADEPFKIVFDAFRAISSDTCVYVTGNYKKRKVNPRKVTDNVVLTGYLPEGEYLEMLRSVDATIDLTTRENCLVCGAYESLAVEKPMILSKTKALQEYFNKGAVFTENTVEAMRKAILEIIENKKQFSDQVRTLKITRSKEWEMKKQNLTRIIEAWIL